MYFVNQNLSKIRESKIKLRSSQIDRENYVQKKKGKKGIFGKVNNF